jgi:hypothetical protein
MSGELVLSNYPRHARLTILLRDASRLLVLRDYFRPPLSLNLRSHDAGCQAEITLQHPRKPRIRVWGGSIWYNPLNERDDKSKLDFNPDADFAHERVAEIFAQLYDDFMHAARLAAAASAKENADLSEFYRAELERQA